MIDLDALERLAEKATPGPFLALESGTFGWLLAGLDAHDAEFIAACDKATVAALVRAVRALERLANPMGEPKTEEAALYAIEVERIARAALAPFASETEGTP